MIFSIIDWWFRLIAKIWGTNTKVPTYINIRNEIEYAQTKSKFINEIVRCSKRNDAGVKHDRHIHFATTFTCPAKGYIENASKLSRQWGSNRKSSFEIRKRIVQGAQKCNLQRFGEVCLKRW